MFYPSEVVDDVQSRIDIVDVIGRAVSLKKRGNSYVGLCPFHNEKTPSFHVSPDKQMYHCFGCGAGGDVISFLMNYEDLSFPEAVQSLAAMAGVSLPETEDPAGRRNAGIRERLYSIHKEAAVFYYKYLRSPEGRLGLEYFRKRRFTGETLKHFGLGYAGQKSELCAYLREKGYTDEELDRAGLANISEKRGVRDRFWNRVIFPIMDKRQRVIAFGGRVMGDGEPKYLNSPETDIFNKSRTLYGLHSAKRSKKGYLIACEGYMDVISLHQSGFSEAVASLGTAFTEGHASELRHYTEEVRLCYDADGAGRKAALRAIPILEKSGISARVVDLKPYKDPDEFILNLGREEFQKRLDSAENSLNFEIHLMRDMYDLKDPEGRTRFERAVARRLSAVDDELKRNNYLEAVAAEYMISSDAFKRAVDEERLSSALSGAGIEPIRIRPDGGEKESGKKENALLKAEKLLLTWISDEQEIYPAVRQYLSSDDFSEGLYRMAAEILFNQMDRGEFKPAVIVNRFEEPEDQKKVAELFHTRLGRALQGTEKEKALTELVSRVKRASLDRLGSGTEAVPNDGMDPLARVVKEKQLIEKLSKIGISL